MLGSGTHGYAAVGESPTHRLRKLNTVPAATPPPVRLADLCVCCHTTRMCAPNIAK